MIRTRLLFLFLLCAAARLSATHIVGGEITYRCLGNQEYEVTLTVYRDCYNGNPWFDTIGYIGIYSSNWDLVDSLRIPYMTDDTLPIILTNPCLTAPPDVCVHRSSYRDTLVLPFRPGGYTLVYQRCCRNKLIRNIPDPLDVGASFTAQLSETALTECNTSAVFRNWPPVAICVHQPIDFDHGGTDADGDSLVFRLCTPLDGATPDAPMPQPPNPGPYLPITWLDPPYNLSNVLGGDPLSIDPKTGFMTGVPNLIGNFVVGVCVDEIRNGSIISTTRRDFQYNVADCGQPVAAFFAPQVLCDTLKVKFTNQSVLSTSFRWYFDWTGDKTKTSTIFSPIYAYPDTGKYVVALVAKRDINPCADTSFQEVWVTKTVANAALELEFGECDSNGLVIQTLNKSSDPAYGISSVQWNLTGPGGSQQSTESSPSFTVLEPGDYNIRLIATGGNGCPDTVNIPFNSPIPDLKNLEDFLSICAGDTIGLFEGANPDYQYVWSPDFALSSTTAPNPLAYPQVDTSYQVTITHENCVLEKTVQISVSEPGSLVVSADPTTVIRGLKSQLSASLPGALSYSWEPAASLDDAGVANPMAMPEDTTTYTVTASLSSGCKVRGSITLFVLQPFCDEPYLFFPTGFSPNGDGENDALKLEGLFIEEAYWVIYNRWGEKVFEAFSAAEAWDGSYKGKPAPAETYGYYLRVRCSDGQETQKKGNITLLR